MLVNNLPTQIDTQDRLLTIFRALAAIRVLVAILFLLLPSDRTTALPAIRIVSVVEALMLLIYLSLPMLKTRLGKTYLPIAIGWATVMPLLLQHLTLYGAFDQLTLLTSTQQLAMPDVQNTLFLAIVNQTILVLIVPLIIVGWAYSRSVLFWYCLGIFIFDLVMTILLLRTQFTLFLLFFALSIFRTMLHVVTGVMINQIVRIQLEQQRYLLEANVKLQEYAVIREQLATSRERTRLARELHDTLAHTLSAATVQLEAVVLIWDQQPQKAQQMIVKSTAMMRDGLAETRRALQALRAGPLDHENLLDAISALADSLMMRYPLRITLHAETSLTIQQAAVEHGLYRIVQEAMFNAARHAHATTLAIRIFRTAGHLTITVADDGVGFDAQDTLAEGHFGLRGMVERAQLIDADVQVTSAPSNGTTVTITLPEKGAYDTHPHL
jgi:signal transduction histidine kinase